MEKEVAKLAKMICIVLVVTSIITLFNVVSNDGTNDYSSAPTPTPASTPAPTPTPTPAPVESSIEEHINVYKSGQDITVECKRLSVSGNNNRIWMTNDDVESIRVLGNNNWVAYPRNADPKIDDFGDYNEIWGHW